MYFAGMNGGFQQIGTATSPDGLDWTIADSPVLTPEAEWESTGMIPGSVESLSNGQIRLWYSPAMAKIGESVQPLAMKTVRSSVMRMRMTGFTTPARSVSGTTPGFETRGLCRD